eukprot:SAG22_NODE_1000_length_6090_cov_9.522117_2_plen_281_part_00
MASAGGADDDFSRLFLLAPADWDEKQTARWVLAPESPVRTVVADEAALKSIAETILEQEIDGDCLLKFDNDGLKREFGLKTGVANKISNVIQEHLKQENEPPLLALPAGDAACMAVLQKHAERWKRGRWVLKRVLGKGGSGVVYESSDNNLGDVAIKFCHSPSPEPERLKREAALVQRVASHENICTQHVYEILAAGHLCAMVLELMDESLEQRIAASGDRLGEFEVKKVAYDVLAALNFMHGMGVVHRDIKPANIMAKTVDGQSVYKLIDFSISAIDQV